MVVRGEHELDVLHAGHPDAGEPALEGRERLVLARARVEQRQRVAAAASQALTEPMCASGRGMSTSALRHEVSSSMA